MTSDLQTGAGVCASAFCEFPERSRETGRLRTPFCLRVSRANGSVWLGVLLESYRDEAGLCGRLEQPGVRVQRPGRDMARHTPLREGRRVGPELPRRVHQSGQRPEGGEDLRPVSFCLLMFFLCVLVCLHLCLICAQ